MTEQFEIGDVVALKSGGPDMTVNFVEESNGILRIWCIWFFNGEPKNDSFPAQTLQKA